MYQAIIIMMGVGARLINVPKLIHDYCTVQSNLTSEQKLTKIETSAHTRLQNTD